ncbi:histone deacetylase 1 [Emiliania huxleyi CCMP1516]|uniref:histone deacetylase n=2 Tax=Emiliania huxleyi TaxID=2903 RepID=A0A0D3J5F9_EMIH1|nr:histone deacetylase 1 [Emiliania huxleyi CCMP1516]EOD18744.1 histone deacetylase 1 [Emiliania huxleyi CCMP1516]|eukprot:XP_005771173.1 histone deacetylase 1 [Emiliania huxleyi CCMP1516]
MGSRAQTGLLLVPSDALGLGLTWGSRGRPGFASLKAPGEPSFRPHVAQPHHRKRNKPRRTPPLQQNEGLTDNLVVDCGLDKHMTMVRSGGDGWSPAPAATVRRYHTDAYVAFLEKIELHGKEVANEAANYVLNNSVCFSETAWPYAQIYAGASMHAAELLATGKADIAINWSGGQAHARRDCASGFSYVNDVVLAVLTLLQSVERVLFINVDSVHASGVEEAFYTTDRVMCVSLHRHGDGYFPGSGGAKDAGERAGKGHNINLPVERGFSDADLEALLPPVVEAAAARYQPAAVVLLAGTGLLSGDRLGCMNVTLGGYSKAVECVLALRRPTLLLGGGGYTTSIATRAWQLSETVMGNENGAAALAATREAALERIASTPARDPPVVPSPPAAAEASLPADGAAPAGAADKTAAAGGSDPAAAEASNGTPSAAEPQPAAAAQAPAAAGGDAPPPAAAGLAASAPPAAAPAPPPSEPASAAGVPPAAPAGATAAEPMDVDSPEPPPQHLPPQQSGGEAAAAGIV